MGESKLVYEFFSSVTSADVKKDDIMYLIMFSSIS